MYVQSNHRKSYPTRAFVKFEQISNRRKLEENFCLQHGDEPDFHEQWITLQSNSHQWLDAFPNEGLGQTMTNTMFDTMVKVRLLIPVVRAGLCDNCGKAIISVSHV
jgi:hypothetical protein